MPSYHLYPCPLCSGPAARAQRTGVQGYNKITCPRCGTFVVEPTLPAQPWARLTAEDKQLIAFLPAYIRHRNRRNHSPLLTVRNWRPLARRGRIVAFHRPRPAPRSPAR